MSDKEILDMQDQRLAAMTARDYGKLASLVHDELIYTHSHAGVDDKAAWLASMTSGKVTYKTARMSDRKVRHYGDVALITGAGAMDVEVGGQPKTLRLRFLEAWTRTPKGWKGPCYLIEDAYYPSWKEFWNGVDWNYWESRQDRRCQNCLMHSGFEPSVVRLLGKSPRDLWAMARWNLQTPR